MYLINNDLIYLWLEYNDIGDINVSNLTQLQGIGIGGNRITTLDVRNCNLDIITYENSPNLEAVYVTGQDAS